MEADFACLADLLAVPGWKYAVNLAGSETMLATNRSLPCLVISHLRELVMELRSAPMSTIFAVSRPMPKSEHWRFQNKFLPLSLHQGYNPENQCKKLTRVLATELVGQKPNHVFSIVYRTYLTYPTHFCESKRK